jgi:hypothetical protein
MKKFVLRASVKSENMVAIRHLLKDLVPGVIIKIADEEFVLYAELEGESSRDLNRVILSGLRKVVKKTRIKSEWTCDGVVEQYFDYGLRKTWKE